MLMLLEGLEATTPLVFLIGCTGTANVRILKIKHGNYHQRMNTSFSFKAIFREDVTMIKILPYAMELLFNSVHAMLSHIAITDIQPQVCGCQESGWSSSTDTPRRGFVPWHWKLKTTETGI